MIMTKTIVTFACVNNGRDAIDRRRATFTDLPLSVAIKMAEALKAEFYRPMPDGNHVEVTVARVTTETL